jgi:subtilisin family serine protease
MQGLMVEDVAVNGPVTLDQTMQAVSTSLSGRLTGPGGSPLTGGAAEVHDAQGRVVGVVEAAPDGSFQLDGVSGDDLFLIVHSSGYVGLEMADIDVAGAVDLGDLVLTQAGIAQGIGADPNVDSPPIGASSILSAAISDLSAASFGFPTWLSALSGFMPHHPDEVQLNEIPETDCAVCHDAEVEAVLAKTAQSIAYNEANNKYQQAGAQRINTGILFAGEFLVAAGALAALVVVGAELYGIWLAANTAAVGTSAASASIANILYQATQVTNSILGVKNAVEAAGSASSSEQALANVNVATTAAQEARGVVDNIQTVLTELTGANYGPAWAGVANQAFQAIGAIKTLLDVVNMPAYNAALEYLVELENDLTMLQGTYEVKIIEANAKLNAYLACLAIHDCDDEDSNNNGNDPNNPNNPGPGDPDNPDNPNNPTPPDDPDNPNDPYEPVVVFPTDPNDITGPEGFGDENWIRSGQPLPYKIRFENVATATAPAQRVTITQQLDDDLDARTFRVDDFGWGGFVMELPGNAPFFQGRISPIQDSPFQVDVSVFVDVETGIVNWVFQTIDPLTGEPPTDPLVGFLPPNDQEHIGEGFAIYTVNPKRNAPTGTRIDALATIVFDDQESLDTPAIFNTLDNSTPTSSVNALPAMLSSSGISAALAAADGDMLVPIEVSWTGSDEGSAIKGFDVYVSTDGGPFILWLDDTELTAATYFGEPGHDYAFYSVAIDNAGNSELPPNSPDASTTTAPPDPGPVPTTVLVQNGMAQRSYVDTLRISFNESTNLADLIANDQITNAFTLTNLGLNADLDADSSVTLESSQFSLDGGNLVWSLNMPGASLADGFYELRLDADFITDAMGNALDGDGNGAGGDDFVFHFHRLEGDVNGDRLVSNADLAIVDAVYGLLSTDPGWNPEADLNRDNRITSRDRSVIARTIGRQVLAPTSLEAGPVDPIVFFSPEAIRMEVFTDLAGAADVPFTTQFSGPVAVDTARLHAAIQAAGDVDSYRIIMPASGSLSIASLGVGLSLTLVQTGPDSRVVASEVDGLEATLVAGRSYRLDVQSAAAGLSGEYELDLTLRRFDDYLSLIGADVVMADHALDGAGYSIAVIDTGVNYTLPEFAGRVILGPDFADNDSDPFDTVGHGTHVAGILASGGDFAPGIAGGADIIALKITPDGSLNTTIDLIAQALQWVVDHQAEHHIVAVNLSFGGGNVAKGQTLTAIEPLYQALTQAGVFIASAAGNGFYPFDSQPGVSVLASSAHAAAIGAVWDSSAGDARWSNGAVDHDSAADRLASFSQRDPHLDLLAPGADVLNLAQSGGLVERSGTSMAAPMVAAASVLIRQAADLSGRSLTPGQINTLLRQHGQTLVDGDDENDNVRNTHASYQRLDIGSALAAFLAMDDSQVASILDHSRSVPAGAVNSIGASNAATTGLSAAELHQRASLGRQPSALLSSQDDAEHFRAAWLSAQSVGATESKPAKPRAGTLIWVEPDAELLARV